MMCTIDDDSCYTFTKNTWIGNTGISYHIINNDTGMFDTKQINESIQGSLGKIKDTKRVRIT